MLLPAVDKRCTLSNDILRLFDKTPQNINAAKFEGNDENGLPIFRIVFLNKHSLRTVESEFYLGKTALDANPNFLLDGTYQKLIEVFETGESNTITYDINFANHQIITIEALIVKMDDYLISYSTQIADYKATSEIITAQYDMLLEAHKVLKMGTWILDLKTQTISSNFDLGNFFELKTITNTITIDEYYQLLFTDDIEATKKYFQTLISNNEPFKIERRYITPTGNDKYIEITGRPVLENNVCNKLIGTFRDISEIKYHELEQAKDLLLLEEAKELLSMCTWNFNPETKVAHYSKELSEILEFEVPVVLNSFDAYLQYIHPDDKEMAKENFNKTIATSNYNFKGDRKIITQKGNIKYIEIVGQSIVKNGKVKRVFGTIRDITDEKIKLLGLFEQEIKLQEIQQVLKIGTWSADFTKDEVVFSKELSEILEYETPHEFNSYDEYFKHVAEEEKPFALDYFKRRLLKRPLNFRIERKMISVKGNIKYLEVTCQSYSEKEEVKRLFGTIKDITEKKIKDIKLLESEQQLIAARSLLSMGSVQFDYKKNTFFLSDQLSIILELDEIKPFTKFEEWWQYVSDDEKEISKRNYESGKIEPINGVEKIERKFISAKGNIKYVEFLFENHSIEPELFTGTFRDITQAKNEELKLIIAQKELTEARGLLKMGSFVDNIADNVQIYSKEMSEILEFDTPTEIIGFENIYKYYDAQSKLDAEAFMAQINTSEQINSTLIRKVITQKGNEKYIEFVAENTYINNKLIAGKGTFRDITENKLQELRLLQSEKELIEARLLLKMGTFQVDLIKRTVFYSKELSELLSYTTPIAFDTFEQYLSHIHADDKEKVKQNYNTTIYNNNADFVSHGDRKMVNYLGNICYIEFTSKVVFENGVAVSIYGTFRDITEKKLSDLKIEESELRLKDAQRLSKMGNWQLDLEKQCIHFSPEAISLFKHRLKETLSFEEYFILNGNQSNQAFRDKFYSFLTSKKQFKTINHFVFNDGAEYYVEVIGRTKINKNHQLELIGTYRDITEQYKIDEALKNSEERYKLLFDHNPTMYFTINETNDIISVNQFGLDYLGLDENEVINQKFTSLYPDDEAVKAIRNIELLKQSFSNFWQWEIKKTKKNGEHFWAKETGRIAKNKDGKNIYLIISEDVSDEVESREALKTKQAELVLAKELAEAAAKEKQQFTSIMSHEIRSPLNAVIGITNLLLLEDPKPEQLEELNTLKFAGENLLMLVNDILDFNKIEAGKLQLEKTSINLSLFIKNLHNTFQYKANEKNIKLKNSLDADLPENVFGDPTRIAQILTNLLSNAIKFTEQGFVELTLRKMKTDQPNSIKIRFEVADSGIGIPKEKHHLIFESFSQANTDTNRKFGGTGLGLTITKKLIELHNSNIYLQSEVGKGTTFYFDLIFETNNPKALNNGKNGTINTPKDLVGKRILLVEDNAFNQLVAIRFLEKWEATVEVADNGLIALKKINDNYYDLILMDIQMPEMNGIECTHAIRQSTVSEIKNIPIIAFTAAADTEKDKMIAEGMNDCVSKPFNPDELFKKILHHTR